MVCSLIMSILSEGCVCSYARCLALQAFIAEPSFMMLPRHHYSHTPRGNCTRTSIFPCLPQQLLFQAISRIIVANLGKGPLGSRQGQALPYGWHLGSRYSIGRDSHGGCTQGTWRPTVIDGMGGEA